MSKVNQIQQALLEMSGGEFQKLADAYLTEKGFGRINAIGSVVAANKVKAGTPDTLVATPEKKYVFAEHTTQKAGLLGKMKEDLDKCFDESKTGIPVAKIDRVVFCFTEELNAKEENELAEACQEKDVNLDLFGIDALTFDLYSKYPALARDFLGIPIDTGQIVPPEKFVSLYNKNKLATRLDLGFHFREEELSRLLDALGEKRLIFLSGRAGVGKSRLALETCRRFSKSHPEYRVWCVFGRNRDLWEDLKAQFMKPGHFLILVDDANRVSRFEYIVDLLQYQRDDQQIKVVATVRDYALTKVQEAARPLPGRSEMVLEPLANDQIKELIADEYGIINQHYLERIVDVAQGNPRLAVMAAEVTKGASLNTIHDVSGLYDNYFSSIRKDLTSEGMNPVSPDLLRVAAIVSFFKAVDRTSKEMMANIEKAFDISPAMFWEAADRLHDMEILDMHEDEVVRVSDQVLGTYLYYLAVFEESLLDFSAFLFHFFPGMKRRLIDSINPVLNAFNSERIIEAMRPHVNRVWSELEEAGDEGDLFHLLDVFWFTKKTDTLLWVRDRIKGLDPKAVEIADISFTKGSNTPPSPSALSVLKSYAFAEEGEIRIALDLLLDYLNKRPAETSLILRILIDDYGFRPNSHVRGFEVQRHVVDKVWERAEERNILFSRVFLTVARHYLGTHFENHVMKDPRMIQISRFDLPATENLKVLRERIWQRLFTLYEQEDLREDVLEIVHDYSTSPFKVTDSEVVKADAEHLLPFLKSVLTSNSYWHCTVLQDHLDLLEKHGGEVPEGLRDKFRNDTYALAEILFPERGERRELGLSYEEYEQYKRDKLKNYTGDYTFDDYVCFLERCLELREALDEGQNDFPIQRGVEKALLLLADRNADLYSRVLAHYLRCGDQLQLNGYSLVDKLVEEHGLDGALPFLRTPQYPTKTRWLFHVHEVLPVNDVEEEVLVHLYDLYGVAEQANLPHTFDYLLKYLPLDERVVARVVARILEKAENDSGFAYVLKMLFNPHTEVAQRLLDLFAEDLAVLKQAYLVVEGTQDHGDYKGQVFNQILDLDPDFVIEYIQWKYKKAKDRAPSSHDDQRDYSFIWARPDHQTLMDQVVESIYSHEQERVYISINTYLKTFFQPSRNRRVKGKERERQDTYLLRLINERSEDAEFMEYLFRLIAQFSPQRRRRFVERFVQRNQSIEAFKRLQLEPTSWSSSGSWVPILQGRVEYLESLLPMMDTVDLLPHKQYIKRYIQDLRGRIEQEKKNDFIRD